MVGFKCFIPGTVALIILLSTAQAQNPGSCPKDNGKYRKTSAADEPPAPIPPPAVPAPAPAPIKGQQIPIVAPGSNTNPDQNVEITQDPQCTQDDGKAFVTSDGTYYKLQCFRHGKKTTLLAKDTASSFAECMELCSQTNDCNSIRFAARSAKGGDPIGQCLLYKEEGESKVKCGNDQHDYVYSINPPTLDEEDKLSPVFAAAARSPAASNKPPAVSNKPPSTPDLTCNNQGFEYAVFASNKPDGTLMIMDHNYNSYTPETFKTAKPEAVSKTKSIGINDPTKIYDSTRASGEYVTVNHRAYLFTQEAGEYTFALPPGDDIALLWTGPEAYSGYTRANAKVERVFGSTPPPDYKQTFGKGEYVPIRIMWANGGGLGEFTAEIKAPDGSTIIGAGTTQESPHLVGFSCDGTTAPRFPAYGAES
ncbi:MAG: hypothetical protein Q9222_000158 [Ikaeria aurantiellina]